MSFAKDIEKFSKKVDARLEDTVRATLFQLNDYVIMQTPVKTGRARGSWVASITSPIFIDSGSDKDGGPTKGRAKGAVSQAMGKVYYLANGVPYIGRLEFGSSIQAPQGMARIGVKTAKQALEKLVRSYK